MATLEQLQTLFKSAGSDSSPVVIQLPKTQVLTRVTVLCAAGGCEPYAAGHEIFKLKVGSTYDMVGAAIKKKFMALQKGNAKACSNVRHCVWTADEHKIDSIKVNWSGAHNTSWTDSGDTIITEENCEDILAMMAERGALDTLTITISEI